MKCIAISWNLALKFTYKISSNINNLVNSSFFFLFSCLVLLFFVSSSSPSLVLLFLRLFVLMFLRSIYSIRWLFIIVVIRLNSFLFFFVLFGCLFVGFLSVYYMPHVLLLLSGTIECERTNEPIENNERASNNLCSTKPKTIHLKNGHMCLCLCVCVCQCKRIVQHRLVFILYLSEEKKKRKTNITLRYTWCFGRSSFFPTSFLSISVYRWIRLRLVRCVYV